MKITPKRVLLFVCLFLLTNLFSQTVDSSFGIWKAAKEPLPSNSYAVKGSIVRVNWGDIEKSSNNKKGKYNWKGLDSAMSINKDKPITLLVWLWVAESGKPYDSTILPKYMTTPADTNYLKPDTVYKDGSQNLYRKFLDDRIEVLDCGQCVSPYVADYYAPPFRDTRFQNDVKSLIDSVKKRIFDVRNGFVTPSVQSAVDGYKKIIAVQACLGSTGDFPSYKGPVKKVVADATDFSAYFDTLSIAFDAAYQGTAIHVLHNPGNDQDLKLNWVIGPTSLLHNPWIKMGDVGHAYQLNGEKSYYDTLVAKNYFSAPVAGKEYVRSRSETSPDVFERKWWFRPYDTLTNTNPVYPGMRYRNMLALLGSALHFGLDWSNQLQTELLNIGTTNSNYYKDAFDFYNRNAGQRDPLTATNGFCMLRDGLDASDLQRFSTTTYGVYNSNKTQLMARFNNIAAPGFLTQTTYDFKGRGALLEDVANAIGSSGNNRDANGINDVGDKILTGNYERYLHLINPAGVGNNSDSMNRTSLGWWNVYSSDSTSVYGRYARGISNTVFGKNALYFDIDDNFYSPTRGAQACAYTTYITVWYLDDWDGTGSQPSWDIYYDKITLVCPGGFGTGSQAFLDNVLLTGKDISNASKKIWKSKTYTITDGYFGGHAENLSDFFIKTNSITTIKFALIEIAYRYTILGNVKKRLSQCTLCGLGINPNNKASQRLNVFPNPASNQFTLELADKKLITEINIYNHFGKLVFRKRVNDFSIRLSKFDIGNLPGLYFVNAITANGEVIRKELKVL